MFGRAVMAKTTLSHARSDPWLDRAQRHAAALDLVLERFELGLVDGFFVRLGAVDEAGVEQLLNGTVHGAHAEGAAGLHGVLQLIERALWSPPRRRRGSPCCSPADRACPAESGSPLQAY